MAKKCETGATRVEIDFSNYVKDRIDEVVATGYFGDLNEFMQYAALSAIFDYERYKNV
jgi:Arc/MetJ-type ribon-helix-helix transcriptional regulator